MDPDLKWTSSSPANRSPQSQIGRAQKFKQGLGRLFSTKKKPTLTDEKTEKVEKKNIEQTDISLANHRHTGSKDQIAPTVQADISSSPPHITKKMQRKLKHEDTKRVTDEIKKSEGMTVKSLREHWDKLQLEKKALTKQDISPEVEARLVQIEDQLNTMKSKIKVINILDEIDTTETTFYKGLSGMTDTLGKLHVHYQREYDLIKDKGSEKAKKLNEDIQWLNTFISTINTNLLGQKRGAVQNLLQKLHSEVMNSENVKDRLDATKKIYEFEVMAQYMTNVMQTTDLFHQYEAKKTRYLEELSKLKDVTEEERNKLATGTNSPIILVQRLPRHVLFITELNKSTFPGAPSISKETIENRIKGYNNRTPFVQLRAVLDEYSTRQEIPRATKLATLLTDLGKAKSSPSYATIDEKKLYEVYLKVLGDKKVDSNAKQQLIQAGASHPFIAEKELLRLALPKVSFMRANSFQVKPEMLAYIPAFAAVIVEKRKAGQELSKEQKAIMDILHKNVAEFRKNEKWPELAKHFNAFRPIMPPSIPPRPGLRQNPQTK